MTPNGAPGLTGDVGQLAHGQTGLSIAQGRKYLKGPELKPRSSVRSLVRRSLSSGDYCVHASTGQVVVRAESERLDPLGSDPAPDSQLVDPDASGALCDSDEVYGEEPVASRRVTTGALGRTTSPPKLLLAMGHRSQGFSNIPT